MNTRAFAIVGAIAVLSLAAAPIAAQADSPSHHDKTKLERVDRSRDAGGVGHVDKKSVDKNSADTHRDR